MSERVLDLLHGRPADIQRPPILPTGTWLVRALGNGKYNDPNEKLRDEYNVVKVATLTVAGIRPLDDSVDPEKIEELMASSGVEEPEELYGALRSRYQSMLKSGADADGSAFYHRQDVARMLGIDLDDPSNQERSVHDRFTEDMKDAVFVAVIQVDYSGEYSNVKSVAARVED